MIDYPKNPCRICGAVETGARVTRTGDGFSGAWVKCVRCGVMRISPYPTDAELAAYYANGYLDRKCAGTVSHALRFSQEYRPQFFRECELSMGDLGLDLREVRGLILDFGCANGIFLDYLNECGAAVDRLHGVDISDEMLGIVRAKGYRATLSRDLPTLRGAGFALITLWDVLEHLPDPRATLRMLASTMSSGALLLIQTPRLGLLSERLGSAYEHYLPFEHIHLFTREALVDLVLSEGFDLVKTTSFGANAPPEIVPQPHKQAFDALAKMTDNGVTQLGLFRWRGA